MGSKEDCFTELIESFFVSDESDVPSRSYKLLILINIGSYEENPGSKNCVFLRFLTAILDLRFSINRKPRFFQTAVFYKV